jgi:hypothetical protein
MALKAVLESLTGVPESLRAEYKEQDGKFYLDIDGLDDHHGVGALVRAKGYEKENARKANEKVTQLTSDLESVRNELEELRKNGIPKGDVDKLEQSYKTKFAGEEKKLTDKIASLTTKLEKHLLDEQAMKLATELAAKPEYIELLMPHIRNRMTLEGDEHTLRVLDKDGAPSALNMDDLKKELQANKAFAAILTGSKATGGGAGGGQGGGAALRNNKKFNDLNEAERTEWHREDPEGFRAAAAAARAEVGLPRRM